MVLDALYVAGDYSRGDVEGGYHIFSTGPKVRPREGRSRDWMGKERSRVNYRVDRRVNQRPTALSQYDQVVLCLASLAAIVSRRPLT